MFNPSVSRCSQTGALVFSPPPQQIQMDRIEEENKQLKQLLSALISAQSASVKNKLPEELMSLVEP